MSQHTVIASRNTQQGTSTVSSGRHHAGFCHHPMTREVKKLLHWVLHIHSVTALLNQGKADPIHCLHIVLLQARTEPKCLQSWWTALGAKQGLRSSMGATPPAPSTWWPAASPPETSLGPPCPALPSRYHSAVAVLVAYGLGCQHRLDHCVSLGLRGLAGRHGLLDVS